MESAGLAAGPPLPLRWGPNAIIFPCPCFRFPFRFTSRGAGWELSVVIFLYHSPSSGVVYPLFVLHFSAAVAFPWGALFFRTTYYPQDVSSNRTYSQRT